MQTGSKNMTRKYIFFDIDNTLAVGVPGKQYIPESAKEAIRKLREAGHVTAIATGRAHAMAIDYCRELGFSNMVSDGGYGITVEDELRELRPLDYDACIAVVRECEEKGIAWGVQVDDSDTRLTRDSRFYDETHDIYMKTKVDPMLDLRDYAAIYKLYIAGPAGTEEKLASLKNITHGRYHEEYFFVEPADKAYGIRQLVHLWGGDTSDVVVFGDGLNDLSMFTDEWTCVAMGNAAEELKREADFVTRDAAEDGIYYACEQLGLF